MSSPAAIVATVSLALLLQGCERRPRVTVDPETSELQEVYTVRTTNYGPGDVSAWLYEDDQIEVYRSIVGGGMISVRSKVCGLPDTWHWIDGTSDMSDEEAIAFAREFFMVLPECASWRASQEPGYAEAQALCRDVYRLISPPATYHKSRVCPDGRFFDAPTQEYCGPVKFLADEEPQERCIEVFVD